MIAAFAVGYHCLAEEEKLGIILHTKCEGERALHTCPQTSICNMQTPRSIQRFNLLNRGILGVQKQEYRARARCFGCAQHDTKGKNT